MTSPVLPAGPSVDGEARSESESSPVRASARSRGVGYALVATAACSWGTWPLIFHAAEKFGQVSPPLKSVVVMVVMTVMSTPFLAGDRSPGPAPRSAWWLLACLGVTDALNIVLFFAAYHVTSVAIAVLTHYLTPLLVALAAVRFLGERSGSRTLGAVVVSFAGLVLLLAPWAGATGAHDLAGAVLGASSAVAYATNVLLTKRLSAHFSGTQITVYHGVLSSLFLAVFAAWSPAPDLPALGVVALGALGPGAAAGLFFAWGIRRIPASHASALTLLEPLVAVLSAAIFFGQVLAPRAVVGGALVLIGAILVVRPGRGAGELTSV